MVRNKFAGQKANFTFEVVGESPMRMISDQSDRFQASTVTPGRATFDQRGS